MISFQRCGFPKSEVLPSFLGMEMWTGQAIEGCYAWRELDSASRHPTSGTPRSFKSATVSSSVRCLGWSLQSRGSFEPFEVFCFGGCWRGAPLASHGAVLLASPILLPRGPGVSATCAHAPRPFPGPRPSPAPLPEAPRDPRPRPAARLGGRRPRLRYRCLAAQPGRLPASLPRDQGPRPLPPRTPASLPPSQMQAAALPEEIRWLLEGNALAQAPLSAEPKAERRLQASHGQAFFSASSLTSF